MSRLAKLLHRVDEAQQAVWDAKGYLRRNPTPTKNKVVLAEKLEDLRLSIAAPVQPAPDGERVAKYERLLTYRLQRLRRDEILRLRVWAGG